MTPQSATPEVAPAAPAAPPLLLLPLPLPSGTCSDEDWAEHNLFALLSHVPSNTAFVALRQLATPWTKARHFGPSTRTTRALMAQALASDMLAKGLTPTDMALLYAWAGEAGCGGLQLKAVSTSLLAAHFATVGLKL